MKVTTIGCGYAFSKKNYNQSFLLEEADEHGKLRRMIIDYGAKIPMALDNLGIDIHDIDDVYISHAHCDHIGGLEELVLQRYDWKNSPRRWDDFIHIREGGRNDDFQRDYIDRNREYRSYAPRLITNENLMHELWKNSLRGGLETMEGFDASLETYFEPVPLKANVPFFWQGWRCDLIQQIHIMTGSVIKYTFGLLMSKPHHKTIYFTTDAQHCSPRQIEVFYQRADIIFQDCECDGFDTRERKFIFGSGVHANYGQLAGYLSANSIVLPEDIKAKMILSHYQDFVDFRQDFRGQECDWESLVYEDGFMGFTHVGDVYEFTTDEYSHLERMARTDPLTNLANRRELLEKLKHEQIRFKSSGRSFVVILADIDDFKAVNDTGGHDCGDYVLTIVATTMKGLLRKQDHLGRWGGEEFILLLPQSGPEEGLRVAEKLRESVATIPCEYAGRHFNITMTFGAAVYDRPQDIDIIVKKADEALYAGKRRGKNCVIMAE